MLDRTIDLPFVHERSKFHASRPAVSPVEYSARRVAAFSKEVNRKSLVYLDSKYWIALRRADSDGNAKYKELLRLLEHAVEAGELLCPVSMATLVELLEGQKNPRLEQSAQLLDKLSDGVCAVEDFERTLSEAYGFLKLAGLTIPKPDLSGKHWTRVGALLGAGITLETNLLSESERFAFSNACYDLLWKKTAADCSRMLSTLHRDYPGRVIDAMNKGKSGAIGDHDSFEGIYLSEIRGGLDSLREPLRDLEGDMFVEQYGRRPTSSELREASHLPDLTDAIFAGFKCSPDRVQLPSIEAHALMHAAQRQNHMQLYKPNDLWDYRHAATALALCDMFLTEKSLSHMLNQPFLRVEERFGCRVVHKIDDAIAAINQISARTVRRTAV